MTTFTPSSDNVTFGRGKILFDQFTTASPPVRTGQYVHLGNCSTFSIGIAPETIKMTDYTTETSAPYKQVVKSIDIPIKVTGFEFASANLRLIFMGDQTTYTQTAATVTGETLGAASLTGLKGSLFQATRRSITSATLLQGTTTLASGTDWELYDTSGGVFRVLPTGNATDGTALTANYTASAISGASALTVTRGATKTSVQGRLLFLPANSTGPNNEVVVWNATLQPDGDVGFVGDDWLSWNLTGTVQSDAAGSYGGSAPNPYFQITTR